MAEEPYAPDGVVGLATFLAGLEEKDRIKWCLDVDLLSTHAECPDCGFLTKLVVTVSDKNKHITRKTACGRDECRKKENDSRRTLFFKNNTIFNLHTHLDMLTIVLVIYCFVVQMSPVATCAVVGGRLSASSVCRIFKHCRRACAWYFRTRQWRKLGGEAVPGGPHADAAVFHDGKLRHVVEFDERRCVCVCVHMSLRANRARLILKHVSRLNHVCSVCASK